MNDFQRINQPRVEKLMAMLDTIDKSAASNRTPVEEKLGLLQPVIQRLTATDTHRLPGVPLPDKVATAGNTHLKSRWTDITDMIDEIDIKEVTSAMQRLAMRLDEYVYEKEGS